MKYIEVASQSLRSFPLLLPHPFVEAPMLTLPPAPTIETLTIRPWPDDVIDTWCRAMFFALDTGEITRL